MAVLAGRTDCVLQVNFDYWHVPRPSRRRLQFLFVVNESRNGLICILPLRVFVTRIVTVTVRTCLFHVSPALLVSPHASQESVQWRARPLRNVYVFETLIPLSYSSTVDSEARVG